MAYTVIWLKNGLQIARTPFGNPARAIDHARTQMPIQQRNYGATAVVVKDANGVVLYQIGRSSRQPLLLKSA
jgi:hypothetical protein